MKRGSVSKEDSQLVTLWVPEQLIPYLDKGVRVDDSDRSKFIRKAIREKLARLGIQEGEAA